MSDILSQEQIDALLSSEDLGSGSDSGFESVLQASSVDKEALLEKTCNLFCEQAGSIISNVLNKKIEFAIDHVESADLGAVRDKINTALLMLKMPLKSGLDGEFYLIIAKKDVASTF